MISVLEGRIADAYDSRSASYPGTAVASSYDFGSIDFFFGDGENSMPVKFGVNVDRPNTNTPLVAGTVNAGAVGGAKTNAELDCTTG